MGNYTKYKRLYKADPVADARRTFNITKMLNDNWDKLDAPGTFAELEAAPGTNNTQTVQTVNGLDTWTTVIYDTETGAEIARQVETESRTAAGLAKWVTEIDLGGQKTIITDEELPTGWKRMVTYGG